MLLHFTVHFLTVLTKAFSTVIFSYGFIWQLLSLILYIDMVKGHY